MTYSVEDHLCVGNRCLLVLFGKRYRSAVLSVNEDTIRLSFPVRDFPIEGMRVEMEFYDDGGSSTYEAVVVEERGNVGDGILLSKPSQLNRIVHRSAWRVPVELTANIKGHVHPRKHTVDVLNMSAGGILIRTAVELNVGDMADISLMLPEGPREQLIGTVMHLAQHPGPHSTDQLAGIKFEDTSEDARERLTRYIWQRLHDLHPESMRMQRQTTTTN